MPGPPRVLFTRPISFVIDKLRAKYGSSLNIECISNTHQPPSKAEILAKVPGSTGLFCLLTDEIDSKVLDAAGPSLKVVSTMSVGYNHIDIQACSKRKVKVGYTPGVLDTSTAETAVALIFATKRRLIEVSNDARNGGWGTWHPYQYCGSDLSGSTVGIIGLGRIGSTVGRMLSLGFNCKIIYTSRTPRASDTLDFNASYVSSLEDLLKSSDVVTIHCALTSETKNLIGLKELRMMKKSAVLINTSRGEVVDQRALYKALVEEEIAAAGLDVTAPEPLPPSHELYTLSNCTILPHVGSATVATRNRMATLAMENLIAGIFDKELPHFVKE